MKTLKLSGSVLLISILSMQLNACSSAAPQRPSQKSADSKPKPAPVPAPIPTPVPAPVPLPTPAPNPAPVIPVVEEVKSKLLGSWTLCSAGQSEFFLFSYKDVLRFIDDEKMEMTSEIYFDNSCTTAITAESVAKKFADIKRDNPGDSFVDEEEQYFKEFVGGSVELVSYKADKVEDGKVGKIDMKIGDSVFYSSYKIDGNKLFVAESCENLNELIELDSEGDDAVEDAPAPSQCNENGITADQRAKNFATIPLIKTP